MSSTILASGTSRKMTAEERKIVFASSLGAVFEWYDFYLYGSLAAIVGKQFFSGVNETASFIFALLAFAAGFAVRPFGALVFGRIGDLVGRKYTFFDHHLVDGSVHIYRRDTSIIFVCWHCRAGWAHIAQAAPRAGSWR